MLRFKEYLKLQLLCVSVFSLAWGCGEPPPVGSGASHPPALSKPTGRFGDDAAMSNLASNRKDILDLDGGSIGVRFDFNPRSDDQVSLASAKLKIPPGALGHAGDVYTITMHATAGETLGGINILFGPAGTRFGPDATLTIVLYGQVSAEDIETAAHVYADGRVESVATVATDLGPMTVIVISVPGFSRYGWDDDGAMSEESEI